MYYSRGKNNKIDRRAKEPGVGTGGWTRSISTEKTCTKCNITKPIEEFHKKGSRKGDPSIPLRSSTCKTCKSISSKSKEGKLKSKNYYLKKLYGINVAEYNRMFTEQEGKCWICGTHQSELTKSLCVDHCHETGDVRALLCLSCNSAMGYFNDDPEKITKALEYILTFKKQDNVILRTRT